MLSFKFLWIFVLLPLPAMIKTKARHQQFNATLNWQGFTSFVSASSATQHKRKWLWGLWALLLLACSRPTWFGDPIELPVQGRDLMLAVDLSGSMAMEDMQVQGEMTNRLNAIKHLMSEFIEQRVGDRLGLILFGTHAYLQAPLTFDRKTIAQYLKESEIQLVGESTAIGEAIALGVKRFHDKTHSNKVLILLSDGRNSNNSLNPVEATELAKHAGVTIYSIGIGADEMEHKTLFGTFKVPTHLDLDEVTLTKISNETGGRYFRARTTQDLEQIYQLINKLEPISEDTKSYRPHKELFYWPLACAVFISLGLLIFSSLSFRQRTEVTA